MDGNRELFASGIGEMRTENLGEAVAVVEVLNGEGIVGGGTANRVDPMTIRLELQIAVAAGDDFRDEPTLNAAMGQQLTRGLQLAVLDRHALIVAIRPQRRWLRRCGSATCPGRPSGCHTR